MSFGNVKTKLLKLIQLLLLWTLSGLACAEIIDDIRLTADPKGEVDAVIEFNVPIQYVRHFPHKKTLEMVIYFNISGNIARDQWENYESTRTPPSDIVRAISISTRDLATGPKLMFQFRRPVEFSVVPGKNGQSILVHIKPEIVADKKDSSSGLPTPVPPSIPVATAAPVAAPLPVPSTTKAVATTTEAPLAASSVSASVPQQPPAPKPVPAPEREAVKPAPTPSVPALLSPPVARDVQYGGKDGLPFFPKIDPVVKETSGQAAETLPLAEQVKRANNQAAALMVKGRDALFRGELFTAIDAFNAVLNLPQNKYSADAQLWIGIAKERSGQPDKARLEYESYLKLYPNAAEAAWATQRLTKLQVAAPAKTVAKKPVRPPSTQLQTSQYGSLSMYYYRGKSWTNTTKSVNGVEMPDNSSKTDQSSLITLISMTARAANDEFDNRLVFQGNKSQNFLDTQRSRSRLSSAYYDVRNRIDNYSARLGVQSGMGGGVLGRFLGISAGYGFSPDWKLNFAKGTLTDAVLGQKPSFNSVSLDFGVNSPLGGSAYIINQTVEGITDRRATGGNLRYFEQGKTLQATLDYDVQFKLVNFFTLQGTLNLDSGTDYNFMIDHRRTPSLSVMDAVYGAGAISSYAQNAIDPTNPTSCIPDPFYDGNPIHNPCLTYTVYTYAPATIRTLLQNGFTQEDILMLAKKRTAISNVAQIGMTQRFREKWQAGADFSLSDTSGMPESGTNNGDGTTGVEGYFPATPSSGITWTISGRLSGTDVITKRDMSTLSFGYTKGPAVKNTSLFLNNRSYPSELLTLDNTLRGMWVHDIYGGKQQMYSIVTKTGYNFRRSLTWEVEFGLDLLKITYSSYYPAKYKRAYASTGFRWDF